MTAKVLKYEGEEWVPLYYHETLRRHRDQLGKRVAELEAELETQCWEYTPAMAQAKIVERNKTIEGQAAKIEELEAAVTDTKEKLQDPQAVHVNMLRGTIAIPSPAHMQHLWGHPPHMIWSGKR